MTMLTYALLTDPALLEASAGGRQSPSMGTVYLLVTNTAQTAYSKITVTVPVGNGAGDLTQNSTTIKPNGEHTDSKSGRTRSLSVQAQGSAFHITDAGGSRISFGPGDYMVLTLANVTVAPTPGLAVLTVTEAASRSKSGSLRTSNTAVALVKSAPKEIPAPRDFRPDKVMVNAGETITLSWDGPVGFSYEILHPGGQQTVSGGAWSPPAPNRATTYTLIATDPTTRRRHFLTTTVQVRNPTFDSITAANGIDAPWVQGATNATKGRVTFTGTGAEFSDSSGGRGEVMAGDGHFNNVFTPWIGGPNSGDGTMTFPQGGVIIWRTGGTNDKGTLTVNKVITTQVHGAGASRATITFEVGTEEQEKNVWIRGGVRTDWIRGLGEQSSWIRFPHQGIIVRVPPVNSGTKGDVSCASVNGRRV